jgi:hypothetical protein
MDSATLSLPQPLTTLHGRHLRRCASASVALVACLAFAGAAPSQLLAAEATEALLPQERIDQLVEAHLESKGIAPNPVADDSVFVRRAYLDLAGRIPTLEETRAFLASADPGKRAALVDRLVGSPAYHSHAYNYWSDLLRARTQITGVGRSVPAGVAYERWLKEAIRTNLPYDEIVRELVTASGYSWDNPAVGYTLRDFGMPLDNLAITSQVFLGTQIVCAQCHDHPFDEWTQMDYYQMAAFTYPLSTVNNPPAVSQAMDLLKSRRRHLNDEEERKVRRGFTEILFPLRFNQVVETDRRLRLPHDYQYDDARPRSYVAPATMMGPAAPLSSSASPVEAFGQWLTSPENPRFSVVMANRLWKEAMGLGLVEPVDDWTAHTRGSVPGLMEYLGDLFVELEFDVQAFQRIVHRTRAYQREASIAEPELGVPYDFPGPVLRRMSAEQVWDSLVALAMEDADEPNLARELANEERVAHTRLIAEAVYHQGTPELLRNALLVVEIQERLSEKIAAAEAKVVAARESGDDDQVREATAEVRAIRGQLAGEIENRIYLPALAKRLDRLDRLVERASLSAEEAPRRRPEPSAFLLEAADHIRAVADSRDGDAGAVGATSPIDEIVAKIMGGQRREMAKARRQRQAEEQERWEVRTQRQRGQYAAFAQARQRLVRASEMNVPAPPSHFLREFGQSDRELTENSSDEASITQALSLLNGTTMSLVGNRYSAISRATAGQPLDERLDTIYLAMLSRLPTEAERTLYYEARDENRELVSPQRLVWTVLNTREFLFVQ